MASVFKNAKANLNLMMWVGIGPFHLRSPTPYGEVHSRRPRQSGVWLRLSG